MLKVASPVPRGQTSSRAESFRTAMEGMATPVESEISEEQRTLGAADDDMKMHATYIPAKEINISTHMQGNSSPDALDQSPYLRPPQLRIRKKRITRDQPIRGTPAHAISTDSAESTEVGGLGADNVMNDNLYDQLRRKKMDRIEAIEDGRAIEAVIIATESARRPSLRHIKKRHSLRMGSANSEVSNDSTKGGAEHANESTPELDERRMLSAKHKKALQASRAGHKPVIVPVEQLSNTSAISSRTLRHERRPVSADGKPHTASSALSPLLVDQQPRRVSMPSHLRDVSSNAHGLRRVSKEKRLENTAPAVNITNAPPYDITSITYPSLAYPGLSPSIKSHRFANTQTPMSGISDRTEMELCEAKNVTLYSHSNESVLLINNGNITNKKPLFTSQQLAPRTFRPLSFTFEDPESTTSSSSGSLIRSLSTPEIQINGTTHGADSPLTNPRAAPMPPAIQFIPPTPSVDDERQTIMPTQTGVQRSGSLLRTARRLSDTILTPLFTSSNSYRHTPRSPHVATSTNDRLHPMWTPNYMWDDDDDYDYSDDEDYDDDLDRLPAGGDTSEHPTQQSRRLFPRQMSVRMPGFRGTGGFLLGNSLGVERHGTNKRRHHVDLPAKREQNTFMQSVKRRVKGLRATRGEAARERRRADLKESIAVQHNI